MSQYSRDEAAQRAGITVEKLTQLVDLGVLGPRADDVTAV